MLERIKTLFRNDPETNDSETIDHDPEFNEPEIKAAVVIVSKLIKVPENHRIVFKKLNDPTLIGDKVYDKGINICMLQQLVRSPWWDDLSGTYKFSDQWQDVGLWSPQEGE